MDVQWAPGMRFQFVSDHDGLGTYAGCYALTLRQSESDPASWWFQMEDPKHPEYGELRHVQETYMVWAPLLVPTFSTIEEAEAWLDANAR